MKTEKRERASVLPPKWGRERACPASQEILGPHLALKSIMTLASILLSGFQVRMGLGRRSAPTYSVPGSEPSPLNGPVPPTCWRLALNAGAWALSPGGVFCVVWEGQRTPFVNRAEITWWAFLAGTGECDCSPRSGVGTTKPWKCASNYSVHVAGWTQAFYRVLVRGTLTGSSRGERGVGGTPGGQSGRGGQEKQGGDVM